MVALYSVNLIREQIPFMRQMTTYWQPAECWALHWTLGGSCLGCSLACSWIQNTGIEKVITTQVLCDIVKIKFFLKCASEIGHLVC